LLNPDNIVAAQQIESAISPILANAPIIGHIDVITKPGHMLALIATQLARYRAEKTGGRHRIADNRTSNTITRLRPIPETACFHKCQRSLDDF
jgi:hypothetical protein